MTREEAKDLLDNLIGMVEDNHDSDYDTALHMAIEALEQEPKFIAKSDGTIEQIKNCNDCLFKKEWEKIGKLISTILEKQTEQEPRWIPVSEDLPKPKDAMSKISDDVLVTDGLDMFVAWYHRDDRYKEWRSTDRSYDKDTPIIAWMPLPKPYEVGSEE